MCLLSTLNNINFSFRGVERMVGERERERERERACVTEREREREKKKKRG